MPKFNLLRTNTCSQLEINAASKMNRMRSFLLQAANCERNVTSPIVKRLIHKPNDMDLNEKIIHGRKAKGLTQEELAALTKVNLRTIQRLESGKSKPRAFTLKAIENVLGIQSMSRTEENTAHFLHLLCVSCFSYLVLPYLHFLVPNYLLNRSKEQNPEVRRFAKKVIHEQIWWVIATTLVFLIVLLINFI